MKFISTANFGYKTIEVLREELKKVGYQTNYWHDKFEHRAFGEIKDGNLSYEEWRDIYTSNGWVEVSEYQSCYDPKSVTSPKESASYELDKAYLTIWKIWYKYEQLWEARLNKLDVARFDLRRVTQTPKITIDEALFICLGLSPSVFGSPQFRPLSLYERTYEIDDIHYQDYEGNNYTINSGLYDEKGLSPIEWYFQSTEEFHLIDENEKFKCVSGRLFTKKFLKWAFNHKYLSEYEVKERNKNDSPYGEKFARVLYDQLINKYEEAENSMAPKEVGTLVITMLKWSYPEMYTFLEADAACELTSYRNDYQLKYGPDKTQAMQNLSKLIEHK